MDDKKNIKTKDKKLSENKKTEDKSLGLENDIYPKDEIPIAPVEASFINFFLFI